MRLSFALLFIGVFIVAVSIPFAFSIFFTMQHETAHQEVFRLYGQNSTILYSFFGISTTTPDDQSLDEATNLNLAASQSEVEAFGYQLRPVVTLLSFITSILFLLTIIIIVGMKGCGVE
jgi:ABC-type antimicrobial peptide transport system permease subunit